MSDHYYLWAVVLVGPAGQEHIVVSGIGKRHRADKVVSILSRAVPQGWAYKVKREAA